MILNKLCKACNQNPSGKIDQEVNANKTKFLLLWKISLPDHLKSSTLSEEKYDITINFIEGFSSTTYG